MDATGEVTTGRGDLTLDKLLRMARNMGLDGGSHSMPQGMTSDPEKHFFSTHPTKKDGDSVEAAAGQNKVVELGFREKPKACSNCGGSGDGLLSKCSACKWTVYCSKDCQREHWKQHKLMCKKYTSTPVVM